MNVAVDGAHLKGIGGAGAPHLFRLERFGETGALSKLFHVQPIVWVAMKIPEHTFLFQSLSPSGLSRADLDGKFWRKRGEPEHTADVILRTNILFAWCP